MNLPVRPELPTASRACVRGLRHARAAVDNSAPLPTHLDSTYKSRKAVQTNGATSQISLRQKSPIPCAAIANDEHNCLAMLRRRKGESLRDLLVRLGAAIAIAWNEERFIDDINTPDPAS